MSLALTLIVPFAVALLLLGIFHLVAYLHMQLSSPTPQTEDRELEKL